MTWNDVPVILIVFWSEFLVGYFGGRIWRAVQAWRTR